MNINDLKLVLVRYGSDKVWSDDHNVASLQEAERLCLTLNAISVNNTRRISTSLWRNSHRDLPQPPFRKDQK